MKTIVFIFLVLLPIMTTSGQQTLAENEDIFVMTNDNKDAALRYADSPIPSLKAFTFCFWLNFPSYIDQMGACVFSYKTASSYDEISLFIIQATTELAKIVFRIHHQIISFSYVFPTNILPSRWNYLCTTYDSALPMTSVTYIDGQSPPDGGKSSNLGSIPEGYEIEGNGEFVFGQALKDDGTFDSDINGLGGYSDYQLWSRALSSDEILKLATKCEADNSGDVISWKKTKFEKVGAVKLIEDPKNRSCTLMDENQVEPFDLVMNGESESKISYFGPQFLPRLEDFTICWWMNPLLNDEDIIILAGGIYGNLEVYLNGNTTICLKTGQGTFCEENLVFFSSEWQHVCIAYNGETLETIVKIGDMKLTTTSNRPMAEPSDLPVSMPIYVGQAFEVSRRKYAFSGRLTELNIWDKVLNDEEMEQLSGCGSAEGNIVAWRKTRWVHISNPVLEPSTRPKCETPSTTSSIVDENEEGSGNVEELEKHKVKITQQEILVGSHIDIEINKKKK